MEKGDQTEPAAESKAVDHQQGDKTKTKPNQVAGIKSTYVSQSSIKDAGATSHFPVSTSLSAKAKVSPFSGGVADPDWNKSGLSDPLLRPVHSVPAVMRMGAQLELHSHLAINLFRGRRGDHQKKIRPIFGLARFARNVAAVWSAAEMDDPFADQCLVDIEIKYGEIKDLLDGREKTLSEIIGGLEGLSVDIQTSTKPAAIDLQFYCPWSYKAAMLLVQFDRVVRLGLTARHLGLMGDQEWDAVVSDSGRVLRHIFSLPSRWVNTGVTRDDIRKKTKISKRAFGMYSESKDARLILSAEVLSGEVRAALSPTSKALDKYLASQLTQKTGQ